MNNDPCSIISKIFAHETNVTKMEKGPLTDCIDMRYHTKGLREQDTVSLHISTEDSGGRG